MKKRLQQLIENTLQGLDIKGVLFLVTQTDDVSHGDYASNVALVVGKLLKKNPRILANELAAELSKRLPDSVERVEVAGPGFINLFLSRGYFTGTVADILKLGEKYGCGTALEGKKVMVEYTDPNPFKEFHIGHLMSNTIGESISRLIECAGAEVKRACYQGDVGLHVAKAVWGMQSVPHREGSPLEELDLVGKARYLGHAYALGAAAYDDGHKEAIEELNKKIYDRSDSEVNKLYDWGRKISLEYFEKIYKRLGTKFDFYFFESEMAKSGTEIVGEFLKKGVFEESDLPTPRPGIFFVYAIECNDDSIYIGQTQDLQKRWKEHCDGSASDYTTKHVPKKLIHYEEYSTREEAVQREHGLKTGFGRKWLKREYKSGRTRQAGGAVVFRAEKYDPKLHTRVFLTSQKLPTYEAKELGLHFAKAKKYKADISVVITANEQDGVFSVGLEAFRQIDSDLASKIIHLSHGVLRLPSGKMSSRKGEVITAESLIADVAKLTEHKIKDRDYDKTLKKEISEAVSVGALKYSILRQAIGGDIVFDFEKSISFEGDSGPYLQYAATRAQSVLEKAEKEGIKLVTKNAPETVAPFERLLSYFPEIVERACTERAPHLVVTYLVELAGAFNNFYATEKIVDKADPHSLYKLALTKAFRQVMENGLWILGIQVPSRM